MKFFYNGIKSNGVLYKGFWSKGNRRNPNAITFYARGYKRLSQEIHNAFKVQNDTDAMTDYFDTDSFVVGEDHVLYTECLKAYEALNIHHAKVSQRREIKRNSRLKA